MTRINVSWEETRSYAATIEVEDFDPENDPRQQIRDAICELDDLEDYELAADEPITDLGFSVITEGDES